MHKVFVYGSLKQGFGNHVLLDRAGSTYLGDGSLSGCLLYSLGAFPGAVYGDGTVYGELYEVDDDVLLNLDRLEGHPRFYKRSDMTIDTSEGQVECQGYIYQGDVSRLSLVESGVW